MECAPKTQSQLRVSLTADDVLFYLHIPKTGGLSLISVLDAQFPLEQICPVHGLDHTQDVSTVYSVEQLKKFRLFRGHFMVGPKDTLIYKYITQKPVMLTLLRDPVARVVSTYKHIVRNPSIAVAPGKIDVISESPDMPPWASETYVRRYHEVRQMTLAEFASSNKYYHDVDNRLTTFVVGAIDGNPFTAHSPNPLPDETRLAIAKQRLQEFAFFGITERFYESLQLLAYTFGWPPPTSVPEINTAPQPFEITRIPDDALAAIRDRTRLDHALYQFALTLFDARYQRMVDELLEANAALDTRIRSVPAAEHQLQQRASSLWWSRILRRKALRQKFLPNSSRRERAYLCVRGFVLKQLRRNGGKFQRQ